MSRWLTLFTVMLGVSVGVVSARADEGSKDRTSSPQWLGLRLPDIFGESSVLLRRTLSFERAPNRAMLRIYTDFVRARVSFDGVSLGVFEGIASDPVELRSSLLTSGSHEILVDARVRSGIAFVAVEMRIDDATGSWSLVSDREWQTKEGDGWVPGLVYGALSSESWGHFPPRPSIGAVGEYNQWKEATTASIDLWKFDGIDGFEIERLRSAREGEGSWVSLVFDAKGRLVVSREDAGLLRFALDDMQAAPEVIHKDIGQCRGLVWKGNDLYANSHGSGMLCRLRDTTGDDLFDTVEPVQKTDGGGDHGRNDVTLGCDGLIYAIHGDGIAAPAAARSRVPLTYEFRQSRRPLGGFVARTDGAASWEIFCSGLRNPFGIAMNREGELFTYDADHERDQGLPDYRPTRIHHLVSGGDYGWRSEHLKWPAYYPDSLPSNLDIGKGSPTSVAFGYESRFPPRYREALFALDWTYGRVLAVHLHEQGASYRARAETFLRGRPFNVTDLAFGPDGALYLVTGGRGTRSALVRVKYAGPKVEPATRTPSQQYREQHSADLRRLRRQLEAFHEPGHNEAIDRVWHHLNHSDRWIRHAARVALEHQDVARWRARALEHREAEALLALARVGPDDGLVEILDRLKGWSSSRHLWQKECVVRTASIISERLEETVVVSQKIRQLFSRHFPTNERTLDRDLCALLADHGDQDLPARTLPLLARTTVQGDRFLYLSVLADVRDGWTPALRETYFAALAEARFFVGDFTLPPRVREIEKRALASLPEEQRQHFSAVLNPAVRESKKSPAPRIERPHVRKWSLSDFQVEGGVLDPPVRDRVRGQRLFSEVLCSRCHRHGPLGQPYGPNLTEVASRFDEQALLSSIIEPSRVVGDKFRSHVIVLRDGSAVTGQIVLDEFREGVLHLATDAMDFEQVDRVKKSDILSHEVSPISPMPEGLLDTLTREEILDLLAFVLRGARD